MLSADVHNMVPTPSGTSENLKPLLEEVVRLIPPLWPLQDYVAVNPWFGMVDHSLLETRATLRQLRNCELLPGWTYFRSLWQTGEINHQHLEWSLQRCLEDHPELYADVTVESIQTLLESSANFSYYDRLYFTVSESIDQQHGSHWNNHIINDITRLCSAYFDQGQAIWETPWKQESLFQAWKETNSRSHRLDFLGLKGFRKMVQQLPNDPTQAIEVCLIQLDLPPIHWKAFLQCQLLSVFGWACFAKRDYDFPTAEEKQVGFENLIGLLAIRLAYDVALRHKFVISVNEYCPTDVPTANHEFSATSAPPLTAPDVPAVPYRLDELARYLLLVATEISYQQQLIFRSEPSVQLSSTHSTAPLSPRQQPLAQLVFCIDVRSEVYRRNLERLDSSIETFGFAGFFGIPMDHIRVGEQTGTPQLPVLLQPKITARDCPPSSTTSTPHDGVGGVSEAKRRRFRWLEIWKNFRTSAVSCFSFVESLGLMYSIKLFTDSMGWTRPVEQTHSSTGHRCSLESQLVPSLFDVAGQPLSLTAKADLAEGILRNLGLTSNFAPLVVFCGHQADVVNNPYRAGLDCGACGGHSGSPNARAAAALFNDLQVRLVLDQRGISIPSTTCFLAAVHHTTTDDLELIDVSTAPINPDFPMFRFQSSLRAAADQCRQEKAPRTNSSHPQDFYRRSRDWAEVRPEWGLAGNAALIAAPRDRTQNMNLQGRTFLHSYDHRHDTEGKVLELIMTAPMVVANWINMQYYASTVDNRAYGSGNKLIHNVVGKFGILEGNGGDLKTGLPWQSLHDGSQLQHPPLRLTVFIEAPREKVQSVIRNHTLVSNLVSNGWIQLMILEDDNIFRWSAAKTWHPVLTPSPDHCQSTPHFENPSAPSPTEGERTTCPSLSPAN